MSREIRFRNQAVSLFTLALCAASCFGGRDRNTRDPGGNASAGWTRTGGEGGAAGGGRAGAGTIDGAGGAGGGAAGANGGAGGGGAQVDAAMEAGRDASHDVTPTGCGSCGAGKMCGYLIADGCSAVGTCVAIPSPEPCNAAWSASGCGCDGKNVSWLGSCQQPGLPSDYAPKPIVHTGDCP